MKIAINAGHAPNGNPDPGAIGASGLQEAVVACALMKLLTNYLNQAGFETIEIQENELQDICDISNEYGADLFISLHCNSAENKAAQGTETFCLNAVSEAGKLARCIQAEIVSSMGTVDRGVKAENFYVLKNTDCPAVLVECAFISNEDDEALLASEQGRDFFANAIARGVSNYVAE